MVISRQSNTAIILQVCLEYLRHISFTLKLLHRSFQAVIPARFLLNEDRNTLGICVIYLTAYAAATP